MSNFNTVTIVGVGLIGGSLGLAIKNRKMTNKVVGLGRRQSSIDKAKELGVVDEVTLNIEDAVSDSDLVIIATPVDKIIEKAKEAASYMKQDSILIDVASTKADIVAGIQEHIPQYIHYVGTHPITGSEKGSVEFADGTIFDGASCIVTFTDKTSKDALSKVEEFWKSLGSKVAVVSPQEHDKIIALTSHIPHLLASILVNSAGSYLDSTGGSFKDITRIALSNPEMWMHIFIQNKDYILEEVKNFISDLEKITSLIKDEKTKELLDVLSKSQAIRKKLNKDD